MAIANRQRNTLRFVLDMLRRRNCTTLFPFDHFDVFLHAFQHIFCTLYQCICACTCCGYRRVGFCYPHSSFFFKWSNLLGSGVLMYSTSFWRSFPRQHTGMSICNSTRRGAQSRRYQVNELISKAQSDQHARWKHKAL